MEIQERYELPFESSFDWRTGLFNTMKDLAIESLIDLINKYKKGDSALEWKDEDGLLNFAFEQDLFEKLNKKMIKKAEESKF